MKLNSRITLSLLSSSYYFYKWRETGAQLRVIIAHKTTKVSENFKRPLFKYFDGLGFVFGILYF